MKRSARLGWAIATIAWLTEPAVALDLSSLEPFYDETFVGESAYLPTPELDAAGLGGLSGLSFPLGSGDWPLLTGTVARVSMAMDDPHDGEGIGIVESPSGVSGSSVFAVRGDFSNAFDPVGGGIAAFVYVQQFQGADFDHVEVGFYFAGSIGNLAVREASSRIGGSGIVTLGISSLSGAIASAVSGGSDFTLDLLIDRHAGTVTASLDVPGVGGDTIGPVALTAMDPQDSIENVVQAGFRYAMTDVELDLTRFRLYESSPGVAAWGDNSSGQGWPPASVSASAGGASAVGAGTSHSCAIEAATGNVVCWGTDTFGSMLVPDAVSGVSGTATALATYRYHNCAIQSGTGNVVCWGRDVEGQSSPPASVNGTTGSAAAISVGSVHVCAIQAGTGHVVCWGLNNLGQSTPPDEVNGVIGTASAIAAGGGHSCAIQAGTGIVVCWGDDFDGASTPPGSVNGGTGTAVAIAAGGSTSCAIQAGTGQVVCWGLGNSGQLNVPNSVNGVDGTASTIEVADNHVCAIQAVTGNVVCWGRDLSGESTPPSTVSGVRGTATAIAVGYTHSLAIAADPMPGLYVSVTYSTESIVTGPLSLGLSGLPSTLSARIYLPGVTSPENLVAGLGDVGSFALVVGDALVTELSSFSLVTDGAGQVTSLSYTTVPIDTASATNLTVSNGSFSATLLGTDTSSGLAFEYAYGSSAQYPEVVSGGVPVPSLSAGAQAILALSVLLGSFVVLRLRSGHGSPHLPRGS